MTAEKAALLSSLAAPLRRGGGNSAKAAALAAKRLAKTFQTALLAAAVLSLGQLSCSHFIKKKELFHPKAWIAHGESGSAFYSSAKGYKSDFGEIPLEDHYMVDKWITYFTGNGRDLMRTYLERSSRYLPMMKNVIRENRLPENLVYVALIESGFSPKARSPANAVGYWQFIASTGRRYGLRIDKFVDERRDPTLSTRAAMEFFKDLYSLFGDWRLALSAYNAGEYRVNRAMMKHYSRDFWLLQKSFPRETRNYYPKLVAAARIALDPKKYGFEGLNPQPPLAYDVIPLKKPISLKKLAKALELPYKEMQRLNPAYKGEYAPVYADDAVLRIPAEAKALAQSSLQKSQMKAPKYGYYDFYWYRVRRGDSLYRIARRNRITLSSLKRENGIRRGSLIRAGQRLKVPSFKGQRRPAARAAASAGRKKEFHVARRGDSLSVIAKKHKTSIKQLKAANNLTGDMIKAGQKIRLARAVAAAPADAKFHIVRKGESLIGIAKKRKVNLVRLLNVNSLNMNSVIRTGQRLVLP